MKKLFGLILLCVLAACSGSSAGDPALAVENYFKALVGKEGAKAVSLSCAAWESSAQIDSDTFAMYPATLEDFSCKEESRQGDTASVSCTGKAVLDYNGEKQAVDLAARGYQVKLEGGEWRMCGYR